MRARGRAGDDTSRSSLHRAFIWSEIDYSMDWSLCSAVDRKPGKLCGTWCFKGTRLPVAALFEHIDQGSTTDEFLEWFSSVSREQVREVLAFAKSSLDSPAAVA